MLYQQDLQMSHDFLLKLWKTYFLHIYPWSKQCFLLSNMKKKIIPSSVPEEGFCRNGVDEPLE